MKINDIDFYAGNDDPEPNLQYAIHKYVGDCTNYFELTDAHLMTPWCKVIVSGIEDMKSVNFDDFISQGKTLKNLKQ